MPKYRELREAKGLQAKQVAEAADIDATMFSRFENHRALPIPADFNRILEALECAPSDVYAPCEVRLLPDAANVRATGGAKVQTTPNEYKMTVRLGNDSRDILTREVLQACGYKSIGEWVNACLQRLKSQYEAIRQREKKNPANLNNKANGAVKGRHTTAKPQPATILTQNKSNVKEALPQ